MCSDYELLKAQLESAKELKPPFLSKVWIKKIKSDMRRERELARKFYEGTTWEVK